MEHNINIFYRCRATAACPYPLQGINLVSESQDCSFPELDYQYTNKQLCRQGLPIWNNKPRASDEKFFHNLLSVGISNLLRGIRGTL